MTNQECAYQKQRMRVVVKDGLIYIVEKLAGKILLLNEGFFFIRPVDYSIFMCFDRRKIRRVLIEDISADKTSYQSS